MKQRELRRYLVRLSFLMLLGALSMEAPAQSVRPKIMMRVFWQDRETDQLSYADIIAAESWSINRGWVKGFPKLDADKHDLVQMKHSEGVLLVGVRDHEDGKHQSGWVAIDTGVFEEPHGNHSHWKYTGVPQVKQMKLDADQGNPAHLYVYDNLFYLANDQKNGFTRAVPASLKQSEATNAAKFFSGGGGHITMAAVSNMVGYSTWIDGGGPNLGRVDVVDLRPGAKEEIKYSFNLPSGVIHGATQNSGKVFFAPADGVCWVNADVSLQKTAGSVQVNHIPLGKDGDDKPLRTGAFSNDRNWVLCSTGRADQSALCLINAAASAPAVIKVPINVADGLRLTSPEITLSLGQRYAFLFQDRSEPDSEVQEQLTVVELDPNRDRDLSDARVSTTLPVGASKVEGHHGHHDLGFDAYGRYAVFTEPGEGMLNIMSVKDMKVVARFKVGGSPDSIVAVGAPEHFH